MKFIVYIQKMSICSQSDGDIAIGISVLLEYRNGQDMDKSGNLSKCDCRVTDIAINTQTSGRFS